MAISPIAAGPQAGTTAAQSLGLQDFMKILLTQLTHQDPLKPMDNQQFMAQMAQFTTLQQTQSLDAKLGQLLANQAALQSVGLLGRTVDVASDKGTLTGTVSGLNLQGDTPTLTLATTAGPLITGLSLGQVTAVR